MRALTVITCLVLIGAVITVVFLLTAAHAQVGPNGPWAPRPLVVPRDGGSLPDWMPRTYPPGHPAVTIPMPVTPPYQPYVVPRP
jgi:hypothetical protein